MMRIHQGDLILVLRRLMSLAFWLFFKWSSDVTLRKPSTHCTFWSSLCWESLAKMCPLYYINISNMRPVFSFFIPGPWLRHHTSPGQVVEFTARITHLCWQIRNRVMMTKLTRKIQIVLLDTESLDKKWNEDNRHFHADINIHIGPSRIFNPHLVESRRPTAYFPVIQSQHSKTFTYSFRVSYLLEKFWNLFEY